MATKIAESARGEGRTNGSKPRYDQKLYNEAVLGFKNYWYPIFSSRSVGRKPVSITIMKEPIVLMRTLDGQVKALSDECAHRGTLLSVGAGCMIKGSDTITCPYHGWTYSLNDGMCVAVLPEGPESKVPGKIKLRSYPVEERKGIIWIWMGKGEPVPVEEDVPDLMLSDDTIVKFRPTVQFGNWRWHAENVVAGHAQMIHKDSMRMWFFRAMPMRLPRPPRVTKAVDGTGVDVGAIPARRASSQSEVKEKGKLPPQHTDFPGLGRLHVQARWRRILLWPWLRKLGVSPFDEVRGADSMMMMLPGVFRVPNHPSARDIYYEWYVPVDEDHYIYAQVTCLWGSNPLQRAWKHFWYYLWGKPTGVIQFNNQDLIFTRQTTLFTKRHGTTSYPMAKLSRNDDFHTVWRQFASEFARGEGHAYQDGYKPEDSPLVDMVASLPWITDEAKERVRS
ncbi:MAG: Rieske 2Fe-2S domain-containing protein [Dehalococcoidia bacterium]